MNFLQTTSRATQPFQLASLLRRTFHQTVFRCKEQAPKPSFVVPEKLPRTRRMWSKEESDTLIKLVKTMGPKWTKISYQLNRPPSVVFNRYKFLTDTVEFHGPWTTEELDRLRELTEGKQIEDIDWDRVRLQMPRLRPAPILRLTYKYSLDPKIRFGRWTDEEIDRLQQLITLYGTDNWEAVADGMRTRTKRQCLERWRWQQAAGLKKGRFTQAEDEAIMKAVEEYGENFAKIKEAIGSQRTARSISQHYRYKLSSATDRSPWTEKEELIVYKLCNKYKNDMNKVRSKLGSRRSVKDMWNHYYKIHKQTEAAKAAAKAGSLPAASSTTTTSPSSTEKQL